MRILLVLLAGCTGTSTPATPFVPPLQSEPPIDPDLASYFDPTSCNSATKVVPAAGETGFFAGTIVEPPSTPWRADTIHVGLSNEPGNDVTCNAGLATEVRVWILDAGDGLPTDEAPDQVFNVPAATVTNTARDVFFALDPVPTLEEGQRIGIAVAIAGTYPDMNCVAMCRDVFTSGRDYWSNSDVEPFDWQLLSEFNINAHLWAYARGESLTDE